MSSFFEVLAGGIIASMLAPYFSHFLNKEKTRQDEKLKYLEKSYLLSKKIHPYTQQLVSHFVFCGSALKGQITWESMPKIQKEPFSELHILFDLHLNAPNNLKEALDELHN